VPPASDTVSREGLKPKAETHCGSVHESPVRFTARAVRTRRLQLSAHERKQSLELELEAKRSALQRSQKEKAAAENDKAQPIRDPTNRLLRLLSKSQDRV
jgi:hypothetical protein